MRPIIYAALALLTLAVTAFGSPPAAAPPAPPAITPEQQAAIAAALGLPPGTQFEFDSHTVKNNQTAGSRGIGLTDEGGKVDLKGLKTDPGQVNLPGKASATAPGGSIEQASAVGAENLLALRIGFALAALVFLGVAYWGGQIKIPAWPVPRTLEVGSMAIPCAAIAIWPAVLLYILIGGFLLGGVLLLKNTGLAAAAEAKAKSYLEAARAALDGVNRLPNAAQAQSAIAAAADHGDMAVITQIQSQDGLVNHLSPTAAPAAVPQTSAPAQPATKAA